VLELKSNSICDQCFAKMDVYTLQEMASHLWAGIWQQQGGHVPIPAKFSATATST
jgi:hypothetical protein